MRRALLLAAAVVLSGCGGAATRSSAPAAPPVLPDSPAPKIEAADEPSPAWILDLEGSAAASSGTTSASQGSFCFAWGSSAASSTSGSSVSSSTSATSSCTSSITSEQQSQLDAEQKKWREAVAPAPGTNPRVVATLALAGGGTASLIAWRTAAGKPCWSTEVEVGGGGGGGGPHGPCARLEGSAAPDRPCDALCLDSSGGGGPDATAYVLSGTVPAGADAIRVTVAGGGRATYPLTGPFLPGFPDRRILLLELGTLDWRKLELVVAGAVTRTVEMPAQQAAYEDCQAKAGPPPHPQPAPGLDSQAIQKAVQQALKPYEDALKTCIGAAGVAAHGSATVSSGGQGSTTAPSSQARPTTTP